MSTTMLQGRVLTTLAEIESAAPAWDELRIRCSASPFTSPHLIAAWLRELGSDHQPLVVLVEDVAGDLRAVAPLVRKGRLAFNLPGRVLSAGELLVAVEDALDAWVEVVRVVTARREVALTIIPCLTPGPDGVSGARAASEKLHVPWHAWHRYERYRLQLAGTSLDAWLATWSSNARQQLGKKRRRLERQGEVTFRRLSGSEGYPVVRRLHLQQWPPEKSIAWLHTPGGERIDVAMAAQVASGALIVELDGRPLAGVFWLDSGTRRTAFYAGRDVTYTVGAPGELAFVEFVRLAFEDGVTELDTMGWGRAKDHLRLRLEEGWEIAIGRKSLVGAALVSARRAQLRVRPGSVFQPQEEADDPGPS